MNQYIEIPVETLRRAAVVLIDHLEVAGGPSLMLENDFFWAIPPENRSNMSAQPTELTIGQLTESLENVREIVNDPGSAISFGLVWLADLLRAVGEAVVE